MCIVQQATLASERKQLEIKSKTSFRLSPSGGKSNRPSRQEMSGKIEMSTTASGLAIQVVTVSTQPHD
jgi:hypothetical protein